jgi:hypothetical protein
VVAFGAAGCGLRAAVRTRLSPPAQRVFVDISVFYDELAHYGRWFTLEGSGWVWTPYGVSARWKPYTYGYWVYTDAAGRGFRVGAGAGIRFITAGGSSTDITAGCGSPVECGLRRGWCGDIAPAG